MQSVSVNDPTDSIYEMRLELPTAYQHFIFLSRYSRWLEHEKRREHWYETVRRYVEFFRQRFPQLGDALYKEIYESILTLKILPSMRCLWTAGKALDKDNAAGYNCAFVSIDHQRTFSEIFYLLMVGSGVGFSVERQDVTKLPVVPDELYETDTKIIVKDSKLGWVSGLNELVSLLFSGRIPKWDLSAVRPAGSRLKTFGGRASGPVPLDELFRNVVKVFQKAKGRKLNSIECHSIVTHIASAVLVGGVRRSALISLSNLSDDRMRSAKSGQWWVENPNFALANNSVAYTEKPDIGIFMKEWVSLYESKSGERGIFNRIGADKHIRSIGLREPGYSWGTNPCITGDAIVDVMLDGNKQSMRLQDLVSVFGEFNEIRVRTSFTKDGIDDYYPVTSASLTKKNAKVIQITDEKTGRKLKCTPDHRIATQNRGWVEAQNLKEDDELIFDDQLKMIEIKAPHYWNHPDLEFKLRRCPIK